MFILEESKFEHEEVLLGPGSRAFSHTCFSRSLNPAVETRGTTTLDHWIHHFFSNGRSNCIVCLPPVNLDWWSWMQRQADGLGLIVIAILTGPPIVPKHPLEQFGVAQISQQWSHAFILKPM